MKHIVKNAEPTTFVEWKEEWRSNGIEPGWAEFDGKPMKQTVKAALIEEQGNLCCFCECRTEMHSGHIAHLLDRQNHPDLVLEYGNLLYSCPENPSGIPQTCGQSQGNDILPISPLNDDCETHFAYSQNGNILGKNDGANETIRILNLNGSKQLCESRRRVYEEAHGNKELLSPAEFDLWISAELKRQPDGMFRPFWTTIKYAAGLYT